MQPLEKSVSTSRESESFGTKGERLTWMGAGALSGCLAGLILGASLYPFSWKYLQVDGFSSLETSQSNEPGILFHFLVLSLPICFAAFGVIAGALVGIGVPRETHFPQQDQRHALQKINVLPLKQVNTGPEDIDAIRHPEEQNYMEF